MSSDHQYTGFLLGPDVDLGGMQLLQALVRYSVNLTAACSAGVFKFRLVKFSVRRKFARASLSSFLHAHPVTGDRASPGREVASEVSIILYAMYRWSLAE